MKQKIMVFFIILIVISSIPILNLSKAEGGTGSGSSGNEDVTISMPDVEVISSNLNSTIIEIRLNGIEENNILINDTNYQILNIPGHSHTTEIGKPQIPVIRGTISIPDGSSVQWRILNISSNNSLNYTIYPFQTPEFDSINNSGNDEFDIDYDFYDKSLFYPINPVEIGEQNLWRDLNIIDFQFNPVQYNPFLKELIIYDYVLIEIQHVGGSIKDNFIPNSLVNLYKDIILNYESLNITTKNSGSRNDGYQYLIISNTSLETAIKPLADWRNKTGIRTKLVNLSNVGATPSEIKNYINDSYNSNPELIYVLLVGDIDLLPWNSSWGVTGSDYWYANLTGNLHPEIAIGRISAINDFEVTQQVNKILNYEMNPPISDWVNRVLLVAHQEGAPGKYEGCKEEIRTNNYSDPFIFDTGYGSQGESNEDVNNKINAGRGIINYRGHGSYECWSEGWTTAHSEGYCTDEAHDLNNGNMTPIIYNIACYNADLSHESECLAEAFMKDNMSAVATLGASEPSYTVPNHDFDKFLFNATGNHEIYNIGLISNYANSNLIDLYGESSSYMDNVRMYLWLGDPALKLWTKEPTEMTVDHDSAAMSGSTEFEVTITDVEGALCALSNNGKLIGSSYTDAAGLATITYPDDALDDIDTVDLVITAVNKIPYITTLSVIPPVRQPAEFEAYEGVLIRYPFGLSYEIIAEMSEDVIVTTLVANASEQSTVHSAYETNEVNTGNCEYLIEPSDSYWTRDYGPWFIFNGTTQILEVVDFEYNQPMPHDNAIPEAYATNQGLPYVLMNITHCGGNYMTDGQGSSVSTNLLNTENPGMNVENIKELHKETLGIKNYHIVDDALGEYTEHIDCWAKYLSPDTIMILQVNTSASNYLDLEAAADYFEGQTSCYGTPYNVVRVYSEGEPYTNSLILNNKVFVPQNGTEWDDDAIAAYQAAMPGYEIIGFDDSLCPDWETTDAIHYRTKGIPDRDMIYIDHDPMIDQIPNDAGFKVKAKMTAYASSNNVVNPQIHWKNTSANVWNAISMTADEDTYTGFIPNHPCGETLYYYISANNSQGDLFKLPYIGAPDPFSFNITPVPVIWMDPVSLSMVGNTNQMLSDILTIGNDPFAGEDLDFTLTCSDVSGFGWLSVDTPSGIVSPDTHLNITAYANTTGMSVGMYQETITIDSNDPDTPVITVPVNLEIIYGNNVGSVSVNSPVGTVVYGTYTVNATVQNFGSNNQIDVLVNCSIYEGFLDYEEDFESDDGGYIAAGGLWEYGTPTNDPGAAHSGSYCWGTDLGGEYPSSADATLDSPEIMIPNGVNATLSYWQYYDTENYYDGGNVKVSTDSGYSWTLLGTYQNPYPEDAASSGNSGIPGEPCFSGSSGGWVEATFDLTAYAGETVMLRWHFGSDGSVTNPGWFIDDVLVAGNYGSKDDNDLIFYTTETISINAFEQKDIDFSPDWIAGGGNYTIQITTMLAGDEDASNDIIADIVTVQGPTLAFSPDSYDFGPILVNETDSTAFDIWNSNVGILSYNLSESEPWLEISPLSGNSSGEHDTITIDVNTTGLLPGTLYHADINITSNAGTETFGVDMYVVSTDTPLLDIEQNVNDRGFPIRHAADGDWAGAQDFLPTMGSIAKVDLYLRKFGTPEFDLVVELREGSISGSLLDSVVFTPAEVSTTWEYLEVDFADTTVSPSVQYFIVCPSAPSGVTNSFGYEWGYAFNNQYDNGSFWFTRDGGNLWRDLPTMYEFSFRTYGYD